MAFELVNALKAPTMTFTALVRRRLRAIRHINLVTMAKRLFDAEHCFEQGTGHARFIKVLIERRLDPE